MTHVEIHLMPALDLDTFSTVDQALPTDRPDGLLARYVGPSDWGLAVVVVWASQAQADRFGDVLGPVVERLGPPDGANGTHVAFEAVDVIVAADATP